MTDRAGHDRNSYQATLRRHELALPGLVGLVVLFGIVLWQVLQRVDGRNLESAIMLLGGGVVAAALLVLFTTFRVHRWSVEAEGVRILERPRFPLLGWRRRALVPFRDIIGFRNVESGFDRFLEIVTSHGASFRMLWAPGTDLDAFADAVREAARRSGRELRAASEGLGFWNTLPGIAFIVLLFAVACMIAFVTAWALWDGMTLSAGSRSGYAAAIALLLPVGAGWMLLKSVKRRRLVLASLARA